MKKQKEKILLGVTALVLAGGLLAGGAAAETIQPILPPVGPTTLGGVTDLVIRAVQWFYTIIFVLAVFFILVSAFHFITSAGNQEKVERAKKTLLYAIVGVAVASLSYGIVVFVQNALQSGLQ